MLSSDYETLIEATQLQQRLVSGAEVVILDCRTDLFDPQQGLKFYAAGHIEGAVHADLDKHLASKPHSLPNGGGGRHPLPERAALTALCGAWGIDATSQVVAYDAAGGAFAARAWWLLRWLGHARVAVLNGGLAAWPEPLSTAVPTPAPRTFTPGAPLTRTIDAAAIEAQLAELTLVDARAEERFAGLVEPIDPVAGHIPGATCRPHTGNLGADGRFLPAAELAARFAGLTDPICYCGSGVTAAHNVLAMRHAGLPEPRLYVGSWSDWSSNDERPRAP